MQLTCQVTTDDITENISQAFDYKFTGQSSFELKDIKFPSEFGLGLIVGPSGSGKSTYLKQFGNEAPIAWDPSKAIVSHFADADDAIARLSGVGLGSIPTWLRPRHVLSTGEGFRADLARRLQSNAVIDEFTSTIHRDVAKSCAHAVQRYVEQHQLRNIVFASCHEDIIDWLRPDWVLDTNNYQLHENVRGSLRPRTIELELVPCSREAWSHFRQHHYFDQNLNQSSRCWLALWNFRPVGFIGAIALPSPQHKKAWRCTRLVVLPDFQGLGLGSRINEAVAQIFRNNGNKYFIKTAHPGLGKAMAKYPEKWRACSTNLKKRDYRNTIRRQDAGQHVIGVPVNLRDIADRICWSYEYVGIPLA